MKKVNILIATAFVFIITFVSCNEFLDVLPDNRVELDSREKIAQLLVSAYPNASMWMLAEFASDNTDENIGNFQMAGDLDIPAFFWQEADDTAQDSPLFFWSAAYRAIASANHALAAIEQLGNECGWLNHEKGEALLARAYAHFLLVNIFSQHYSSLTGHTDLGIPYMEKPETTVNPHYERGTVAEVYAKIDRDIRAGIDLIDDTRFAVPKYRFNRRAAAAFAARFNLFYTRWEEAVRYANMVLGDNPRSVLRDWEAAGSVMNFEKRSNNFIDVRNPANLLMTVHNSRWPLVHGPFTMGSRFSHNRVITVNETSQSRGPWGNGAEVFHFRTFSYTGGLPKFQMLKFFRYFEFTDIVAQIGFPRMVQVDFTTDETLLVRAEAYAMLGEFDLAVQDIQTFLKAFTNLDDETILRRVNRQEINNFYGNLRYSDDDPTRATPKRRLNPDFHLEPGEQTNLIHCILHLRRILTLHEGLRWFDIKRYGIEIHRRMVDGFNVTLHGDEFVLRRGDPRRALQIPHTVIDAGLEPNPVAMPNVGEPFAIRPDDIMR